MSTHFFHSKRSRSHSRFFYLILCTVLVCPMLLFTGCGNITDADTSTTGNQPISISSIKLNTAVQITIYDSQDKALLDDCLALCDKYELIFSRTNEKSELYKLNHRKDVSAGDFGTDGQTTPYPVNGTADTWHISEDLAALLSEGLDITRESNGAFDIAIAPLTSLWDFTAEDPEVPDDAAIQKALPLCSSDGVTIDGEDAKDLDDAISLTKEDGIYHLGVHIADVSNYVQGGSALDREALKRGTSVYLADRVIPMLPERLSNGICSLNQGQDRLTLSCLMDVNEKGKVISHKIAETVIRVDERMCYTDVKNILEDTDDVAKKRYEALIPMFFLMKELSGILRSRRHTRGSIDFDFPESKIILNAAGRAIDVQPYEANVATRIIEDFMLLANETVAQEYCTGDYPFVYRTHENPDPEKIESLLMLLHNEGVNIQKSGQEITPGEIQEILESIEGMPNEAQISRLTLRTMKQAKYTTECSGHFGLAAKYYCHFTSPIRRYPDLQIHRIIHDRLRGRLVREGRTEHYKEILDEVARQSSVCERRADEAERESDKLKKAEYMSYHLGEEYEGIISGVTGWGLYVELPNTVEGLIHINTLRDDYYVFDQDAYELRGDMTGRIFRLGQKVRVRVADADKMLKTVDFVLAEED